MIRLQASKNSIFWGVLSAYILYACFFFGSFQAQAANTTAAILDQDGPRYFIKTKNQFWEKSFGKRHSFDDGFTTDLSGIQLTLTKIFGVEVEPVGQLHVLPKAIQTPLEPLPSEEPVITSEEKSEEKNQDKIDILESIKAKVRRTRPIPSDETPWGIALIYNNSAITSTSGGANVNVAVLDTGVLKTHPDLKNRVKQCKDFTSLKVLVKDGSCEDKHGHGTHVSGIILADAGSDKLGIYGVAPEANLFSYKVCGNDGSCWADDIAYAIRVAADNGANVINMSLGGDAESLLIREAMDYAVSKDVLIVAAGGNDGPYPASIDYPAANTNAIAVGAIDISISVPDWSSRGINPLTQAYVVEEKDMEFGAPGVSIESTWKNGGYAVLSGTSMASPHIAGLAAKFWQLTALEGGRASATRDLLHQMAKDIWSLGDDDATGFGLPQVK
ncbi:MAG: S8 family serine peptidase [Patescibacteria group bacterium]